MNPILKAQRLKKEIVTPETEAFRWMLEEFAVSLFAQQLKTVCGVGAAVGEGLG